MSLHVKPQSLVELRIVREVAVPDAEARERFAQIREAYGLVPLWNAPELRERLDLTAENATLREALAGLVGSNDPAELAEMETVLAAMPSQRAHSDLTQRLLAAVRLLRGAHA